MTNQDGTQTAKTFTATEVHGLLAQIQKSADPQREAQISQYFLSELRGFDTICSDLTIRNDAHICEETQQRHLQAEIEFAMKEAS